MKVTRSQLKQLIKEEIDSVPIDNLITGIHGLVQGMDNELISAIFTTVFRDLGGDQEPETEPEASPEAITPIGFGREPEIPSDHEQGRIGFEENLERIIKEEIKKLIGEGHASHLSMDPAVKTLARAGISQRREDVRGELMRLIADLDPQNQEELQQIADMVAQLMDASQENIEGDYGLEEQEEEHT